MSKNFVFTEQNLEQTFQLTEEIQYIIYQKEKCPTTGKEHYQGFIQVKSRRALSWMKKNISPTAHFEVMRGTAQQAREYCMKEDTRVSSPQELGVFITQGKRMDLEEVRSAIQLKKPKVEYEHTVSYVKNYQAFERYKQSLEQPRTHEMEVVWLYGPPGSGKTRHVYENNELEDVFSVGPSKVRWDGYDNQNVVLIDDFRPQDWDYQDLLRLLDRYPYQINVKYGYRVFNSKKIYITTPLHPEDYYKNSQDDYGQLKRRITKIINIIKL